MPLNDKSIKVLKSSKLLHLFTKKNSTILFFSCLDLSNTNFKNFKKTLENNNISTFFIKKSILVKTLSQFPGFHNIKHLLNGPLLIGIKKTPNNIFDFSLKLEKKNKVVVLGCLFDQRLYGSEFVTKLSGLRRDSVNASLISTCLQKQYFLTFLLSKNTND